MKSMSNLFTLILALMGAVIAFFLTVQHFRPQIALPCGSIGDCHGALGSQYGHIGPIPTAALGWGLSLLLTVLCWRRGRRLTALRRAKGERAAAYAAPGAEPAEAEMPPPAPAASDPTMALRTEINGLDMAV